jgi:hypothetical protein
MKMILLVAAIISSLLATLFAVTLCFAGGANASPSDIRMLKLWMGIFSAVGVAGVVAGIVLMRAGQANNAVGAAFAPTVFVIVVAIIAYVKGW